MYSEHEDPAVRRPEKAADPHETSGRIELLDGWRALSILLVLAGHLLPLGPKSWNANSAVAAAGMALFFSLSGFLITTFLLRKPDPVDFLVRRLFRILPLAWSAMLVIAVAYGSSLSSLLANLLFVANLPPQRLMIGGGPLWSLCVEVQFYLAIALVVAIFGRRGLYIIPLACLGVTGLRIANSAPMDIVTWLRLDEILAGATLALLHRRFATKVTVPAWLSPVLLAALFLVSNKLLGPLNYVRPYVAASAIGASLFAAPIIMHKLFTSRPAAYVAEISYAVYVFHGIFMDSWLGSGTGLTKYAKRLALLLATFSVAHLSTFRFEKPMIKLGKRFQRQARVTGGPAAVAP